MVMLYAADHRHGLLRGTSLSVLAIGLSALVAIAPAKAAQSQEQPATTPAPAAPDQSSSVSDIIVTAQFRSQSVQTTPLSITAVNAAMLEQRSQTDLVQVANQAPNVTLTSMGGGYGNSLAASIRGVGQYDFSPALEPGVGIYVDDVYYPQLLGSIFDLLDLDRVEILRGPQGTLAGKNAIGGAVKLFSSKPTGEGTGYVEATYGRYNRVDLRASADFSLVKDSLFVRISGVSKKEQGYVKRLDFSCANPNDPAAKVIPSLATGAGNCVLGRQGGKDYSAIRSMLRWIASDKIEVNIISDFTSDDSHPGGQTLLAAVPRQSFITAIYGIPYDGRFIPSDPYANYATLTMPGGVIDGIPTQPFNAEDRSEVKAWGTSATVDWDLGDDLSLKSITSYRSLSSSFASDLDLSPLPLAMGTVNLTNRNFSQEVRVNGGLFDKAIEFTIGGYYFRQKTVYSDHQDIVYGSPLLDFLSHDPVLAHTKAGFGQLIWHAAEKLNLTGGIRYTAEDKTYTFTRVARDGVTPAPIVGGVNGAIGNYKGHKWDFRAAAQYQWSPAIMTYAQFSTGFKGGGINPRPFFGPSPACPTAQPNCQVAPFNPETLSAYEIGVKSDLFDRKVRLNISAFYNLYKGIQLTLLNCPDYSPPGLGFLCSMPLNAGDAHVKGVEVETELHPVDGLMIDGSLSYLDFKYTSVNPATAISINSITPYTPKWKWSGGAQYEIGLGSAGGTLTPRFDITYQSSIFTRSDNAPTSRISGYTVMNARLTWRSPDRGLQASLEVTNLANKLYYKNNYDLFPSAGYIDGTPARPRSWALTVKKTF
jgi:iron complex outermembrane receptor protein